MTDLFAARLLSRVPTVWQPCLGIRLAMPAVLQASMRMQPLPLRWQSRIQRRSQRTAACTRTGHAGVPRSMWVVAAGSWAALTQRQRLREHTILQQSGSNFTS